MTPTSIDLNCDLGEAIGAEGRSSDRQLLQFISSANIACGVHAGDEAIMRQTVIAARELGVAIGAHPGFPDRNGMGRRSMEIPVSQVGELVKRQIRTLSDIALTEGVSLAHVKPHGTLYHQAHESSEIAQAICQAVANVDSSLRIYGLSGGRLLDFAATIGLNTAREVFADRNYLANGGLVPRSAPNALLSDPESAAQRVLQMIQLGTVLAENGAVINVRPETVCIHSDHPRAIDFVRAIRHHIRDAGIEVSACKNNSRA